MKRLISLGSLLPAATVLALGISTSAQASTFFSDGDQGAGNGDVFLLGGQTPTVLLDAFFGDPPISGGAGATVNLGQAGQIADFADLFEQAFLDLSNSPANVTGGFAPLIGGSATIQSFNADTGNFVDNFIVATGTNGLAPGRTATYEFDFNTSTLEPSIVGDFFLFTLNGLVTRTDTGGGDPTESETVGFNLEFSTQNLLPPGENVGSDDVVDFVTNTQTYSLAFQAVVSTPEPSAVASFAVLGLLGGISVIKKRKSLTK